LNNFLKNILSYFVEKKFNNFTINFEKEIIKNLNLNSVLIDKIKRNPYSVILFDEIEKAHPEVLNILLQIMEEGVVTDNTGRKINFNNCIIILTGNIGSEKAAKPNIGFGQATS